MTESTNTPKFVERVRLCADFDRRVALASVRIGEVLIDGVAVWRSSGGKLRVYFPSYKAGYGWVEAINISAVLRSEIEAEVIAAYKDQKKLANRASKKTGGQS